MASEQYKIIEHNIACGHIRGYPQSVLGSQETVQYMDVKQYVPLNNPSPQPGDVTIIAAHANGFPKELYEPLWTELIKRSDKAGYRIRGIWIADVAWQGLSSVLNEDNLGIHPNWTDHSRDLLYLVNQFRADMPMPIVGIGHSQGGYHLAELAIMHPRLFETLIFVDPIIWGTAVDPRYSPAPMSARRRDLWPSRKAAAESFKKSPFYKAWDPRVLQRWIKHGLRDLPTKVYPEANMGADGKKQVTLTTPKIHEVMSFAKEVLPEEPAPGYTAKEWAILQEMLDPDHPVGQKRHAGPLSRPEPSHLYKQLPHLRPSALWRLGENTPMPLNQPEQAEERMKLTGVGSGGSGGVAKARTKIEYVAETGHLVPMEKVNETADAVTSWLSSELQRFRSKEALYARWWSSIPDKDKHTLSDKFMQDTKNMAKL